MRIFCTPIGVWHVRNAIEQKYPEIEFCYSKGIGNEKQTQSILRQERYVIIGSERVTNEMLDGSIVKAIARFGGSVENLDTGALQTRGVNLYSYKSERVLDDVARLTVGYVINASFSLAASVSNSREGVWSRNSVSGGEARVTVLGNGKVGSRVTGYLKLLGFNKVTGVSLRSLLESEKLYDEIISLLDKTDILVICASSHCWNKDSLMRALSNIGSPIAIVNTARGALVDEDQIITLLDDGIVSEYYCDVVANEPPSGSSLSLMLHPRVISTPHLGGYSNSNLQEVAFQCIESLLEFSRK